MLDLEDKSIKKRHLSHEEGETVGYNEHQPNPVHQFSLRKCNKTSIESVDVTSCNTPNLSEVKVGAEKTPQSMRGSSIFSPGDAFWKEAIQVVDDMSYHNEDLPEKVVEESKGSENDVLNQPNHNRTSNTPSTDIRTCNVNILKSVESSSSSCVTSNDCLDIGNWLPSELCNTYKRKGISKLYPWQVIF